MIDQSLSGSRGSVELKSHSSAAQAESIGRDEHRVRGRALPQHAVKLLRRKVGLHVSKDGAAEFVGEGGQRAPGCQIGGILHGAIALSSLSFFQGAEKSDQRLDVCIVELAAEPGHLAFDAISNSFRNSRVA